MLKFISGEDCITACPPDKPFTVFGIYYCMDKASCQAEGKFGYNGTQCIDDCLATDHKYYYDGLCYDGICPTDTYG